MKLFLCFFLLITLPLLSNGQMGQIYYDLMKSSLNKGDYNNAIEWGKKALIEAEKEFGGKGIDYANCLNNSANLFSNKAYYKNAEPLYLQSMEIKKRVLGVEHPDFATSLNNLASLYSKMGRFAEAEPLYLQSLEITKKALGVEHPDFATSLNNLAGFYSKMGRFAEAEPLYLQSLEIKKKVSGVDLPDFATSLNNLASLYLAMGRDAEAEPLYIQSMEIRKNVLGVEHPDYASSLNNLASLYRTMWQFSEAEPLFLQSLEIRKKILGVDHPDYAMSLNNLAELYIKIGRFKDAEPLFIQSMEIIKRTLGVDHPDYAMLLNNLSNLYRELGLFAEAEPLFLQSMEICRKVFGIENLHYIHLLNNLAGLYSSMDQYRDVEYFYAQSLKITKYFLDKSNSLLSEKEQELFFLNLSGNFKGYQSFSMKYKQGGVLGLEAVLFTKSLFLCNSTTMRNAILSSNKEEAITIFNQWNFLNSFIAKQYSKPILERIGGLDTMERQANSLEKKLSSLSSNFKISKSSLKTTWQDINRKLKKSESVIEFSSFPYFDKKWTDSIFYCAYILKGDDTVPRQVILFEERQLDSLLGDLDYSNCTNRECVSNKINKFHNWENGGKQLYKLIWSKIEPEMKGVKTIYFSPSGGLYKISFPAIPNSDSTALSDKYHLVQLNSTREIALESFKPVYLNDTSSIALFGGIKYDMDTTDLKNATATYHQEQPDKLFAFASRSYVSDTSSRGRSWRYLPGSLSEVEFIKPLFKQSHLFTGTGATEEAFKSLQGKQAPDVLHVATHGFFFKGGEIKKDRDGKIREFEYSNDPMIRSGLMLAGGNLKWKGEEIPAKLEDGILTAKEVAALNLYNTKLVVLSACETGLGDIKGSEGVYGLQRAFKAAGANYLLMSLWTVPDEATAEFMKVFYTKLKQGFDIQTSFEQTQTAMKLKYRNEPYKWAGFVLVR